MYIFNNNSIYFLVFFCDSNHSNSILVNRFLIRKFHLTVIIYLFYKKREHIYSKRYSKALSDWAETLNHLYH